MAIVVVVGMLFVVVLEEEAKEEGEEAKPRPHDDGRGVSLRRFLCAPASKNDEVGLRSSSMASTLSVVAMAALASINGDVREGGMAECF